MPITKPEDTAIGMAATGNIADLTASLSDQSKSFADRIAAMTKALDVLNKVASESAEKLENWDMSVGAFSSQVAGLADAVKKSGIPMEQQLALFRQLNAGAAGVAEAYGEQAKGALKMALGTKDAAEAIKSLGKNENELNAAMKNGRKTILAHAMALEREAQHAHDTAEKFGRLGEAQKKLIKALRDGEKLSHGSGKWNRSKAKVNENLKDIFSMAGVVDESKGMEESLLDLDTAQKRNIATMKVWGTATLMVAQQFGKIAEDTARTRRELADYAKTSSQAAHSMGMIDSKPLEQMRNSLNLTRKDASEFYGVLSKGMSETGKSADELSRVAETLKETFGGNITKELQTYIELLKEIPTLQEDMTSGDFEDKTASLYAIAKSGKAGDLNALMPTGLFGGAMERQEGADARDRQQDIEKKKEDVNDFLVGLLPSWTAYFEAIPEGVKLFEGFLATYATVSASAKAVAMMNAMKREVSSAIQTGEVVAAVAEGAATVAGSNMIGGKGGQPRLKLPGTGGGTGRLTAPGLSGGGGKVPGLFGTGREALKTSARSFANSAKSFAGSVRHFKLFSGTFGKAAASAATTGATGTAGAGAAAGAGGTAIGAGAAALAVAAVAAASVAAGHIGSHYFNKAADKYAKKGQYGKAANNRFGAAASKMAGYTVAGAALGGPIGAAVGALIGLVASIKDIKKGFSYLGKNKKDFGSAYEPAKGKTSNEYETVSKQASDIFRERANAFAKSARTLQDALKSLENGVKNAKLEFFKLQSDLSKLQLTRATKLGGTTSGVEAAIGKGWGAARETFDTKMAAVNKARKQAATDSSLSAEARTALSTAAEKEAEAAMAEFVDALMATAEAIANLPEYMMNQMQFDSFNTMFTDGLMSNADALAAFEDGLKNFDKAQQEATEISLDKSNKLKEFREQQEKNAAKLIGDMGNTASKNAGRSAMTDEQRKKLLERRKGLVEANVHAKSVMGGLWHKGGDMNDEEKAAYEEMAERGEVNRTGRWLARNLDFANRGAHGGIRGIMDQNYEKINEIDQQLAGSSSDHAKINIAKKYSGKLQDVMTTDAAGNRKVDAAKALTVAGEMRDEIKTKQEQLKNMGNPGEEMMAIRNYETNVEKRKEAKKELSNLRNENGSEEDIQKAEDKVKALDAQFESDIKPVLSKLFGGAGMDAGQQQKALDYIGQNGFDRFVQVLEKGTDERKAEFGGEGLDQKIVDALKKSVGDMRGADILASEIAQLTGTAETLENTIVDTGKAEVDAITKEIASWDANRSKLLAASAELVKGMDKLAVEMAHTAELAKANAIVASASGTGAGEYATAFGLSVESMRVQVENAAKALPMLDKAIKEFETDAKGAKEEKEKAQKEVESIQSQIDKITAKGAGNQTKEDKNRLKILQDQLNTAQTKKTKWTQAEAQANKDISNAQQQKVDAHKNIANNVKQQMNIAGEIDKAVQAGMESAKGLLVKAAQDFSSEVQESLRFSDNLAADGRAFSDAMIEAAEMSASVQMESVQKMKENLGKSADEYAKSVEAASKAEGNDEAIAKREAAEARQLVMAQGELKIRQQELKIENDIKKAKLQAINAEFENQKKMVDLQMSGLEDVSSYLQNFGGSFEEVLQVENQIVGLAYQKAELAAQEYERAKEKGITGVELEEKRIAAQKAALDANRKQIGVAKSMMDRMIGSAFGGIRTAIGARVQMGTAQHMMGTKNTRIRRADGTYTFGNSRTVGDRQFDRAKEGMGAQPNVNEAPEEKIKAGADIISEAGKDFKDSATILAETINALTNNLTPGKPAETQMWKNGKYNIPKPNGDVGLFKGKNDAVADYQRAKALGMTGEALEEKKKAAEAASKPSKETQTFKSKSEMASAEMAAIDKQSAKIKADLETDKASLAAAIAQNKETSAKIKEAEDKRAALVAEKGENSEEVQAIDSEINNLKKTEKKEQRIIAKNKNKVKGEFDNLKALSESKKQLGEELKASAKEEAEAKANRQSLAESRIKKNLAAQGKIPDEENVKALAAAAIERSEAAEKASMSAEQKQNNPISSGNAGVAKSAEATKTAANAVSNSKTNVNSPPTAGTQSVATAPTPGGASGVSPSDNGADSGQEVLKGELTLHVDSGILDAPIFKEKVLNWYLEATHRYASAVQQAALSQV